MMRGTPAAMMMTRTAALTMSSSLLHRSAVVQCRGQGKQNDTGALLGWAASHSIVAWMSCSGFRLLTSIPYTLASELVEAWRTPALSPFATPVHCSVLFEIQATR